MPSRPEHQTAPSTVGIGTPEDCLMVAQELRTQDRHEEALAWIETSIAAHGPHGGLALCGAEMHAEAGQHWMAGASLWPVYVQEPSKTWYIHLSEVTGPEFGRWREKAIELMSLRIDLSPGYDHWGSELVETLIWEGDADRAWAKALEIGCHDEVWRDLVEHHGEVRPVIAIVTMERLVDKAIRRKTRKDYRDAAQLLKLAMPLFLLTTEFGDFAEYVWRIREGYRNRPALLSEFAKARLP